MSINASWFWCAQNHWAREPLIERGGPRLQIIRKATLWQKWLLWLQQHLRYVCITMVFLVIGVSMAMTDNQARASAHSTVWTVPVEPPGVVVVTHNSATAMAAKYKPAAHTETRHSKEIPLPGPTTRPAATHVPKTTESTILVSGTASQASLEQA